MKDKIYKEKKIEEGMGKRKEWGKIALQILKWAFVVVALAIIVWLIKRLIWPG